MAPLCKPFPYPPSLFGLQVALPEMNEKTPDLRLEDDDYSQHSHVQNDGEHFRHHFHTHSRHQNLQHEEEYQAYDRKRKYLYTEQTLREVCLGLHSMCIGSESKYFNGHTNITDDAFLVFGVKGIMDTNKKLKDVMLFNILSYMSNQLLGVGNTAASIDEMHLY